VNADAPPETLDYDAGTAMYRQRLRRTGGVLQAYNRRIYNICYRFAGSGDDAQD